MRIVALLLIALALIVPAEGAQKKRPLRPYCPIGEKATIEGVGLVCMYAPKWR